jgi:hypothetical protein
MLYHNLHPSSQSHRANLDPPAYLEVGLSALVVMVFVGVVEVVEVTMGLLPFVVVSAAAAFPPDSRRGG